MFSVQVDELDEIEINDFLIEGLFFMDCPLHMSRRKEPHSQGGGEAYDVLPPSLSTSLLTRLDDVGW